MSPYCSSRNAVLADRGRQTSPEGLAGLQPLAPALAARALAESLAVAWPAYGQVDVRYERVTLTCIRSVIAVLADDRVRGAQATLAGFRRAGLPPYLPALYELDGLVRAAFGPIAEVHGGHLVLIDGANRSFAAWQSGLDAIDVAVIRAERMPLPAARPRQLSALRACCGPRSHAAKFPDLSSDFFRPTGRALAAAEQRLLAGDTGRARWDPWKGVAHGTA